VSETTFLNPENLKLIEKYNNNVKWFMDNYDKIKNENRGKIVAIYNESIITSNRDPEAISRQIREKGITDIDCIFRKYILENDDLQIMH
jgi:hypothetical protein